ncbi:MAG: SLC13 family permease [Conexivisphaera sp.]
MPWGYEALAAIELAALLAFLALRVRRPELPVWAFMSLLAFVSVALGLVPVDAIGSAIDYDVILFLIGMFSLVSMAEGSGLLGYLAHRMSSVRLGGIAYLVLLSLLFGLLSALIVNDTMAMMGVPLALSISEAAGVDPEPIVLLLAFSLTVGSTFTPMGNPQNVLIAVESGMAAPLTTFVEYLAAPTIVNLLILPLILAALYPELRRVGGTAAARPSVDRRDAAVAATGIAAVVAALVANDYMELAGLPHFQNLGFIPFVAAAGAYSFARDPRRVVRSVDWGTIIFFISMFITMYGIWRSGLFIWMSQALVPSRATGLGGILEISAASLALSQLMSNVPFVSLFVDYMRQLGYGPGSAWAWLALAYSSTVAGNLTFLGAASNIIILEGLESRRRRSVPFWRFLRAGAIVTAVNVATYSAFLYLCFFIR